MANKSFVEKLMGAIERNNSLLCVGLDPNPHMFPTHHPQNVDTAGLVAWGTAIIEQTADLVCCYKPNFAFYEQYGPAGLEALRQTIATVPPDIPVLLDAKRSDIGSTAAAYARAAFEVWQADAVTVNPYLGQDSVAPFIAYPGKMTFILCYTSNPSAKTIQEFGSYDTPLFAHIARQGQRWGSSEQVGFVVGATQPQALARVRHQLTSERTYWILAPGIGAQGGDLSSALRLGLDNSGSGLIIPVSRSIIYAASPRAAATAFRNEINQARHNFEAAGSAAKTGLANDDTDLILQLQHFGCIQFGSFTLASGQSSPIYIDLRRLMAEPSLLKRVAQAYAIRLEPLSFDHLAAVPYTALTIGTAVALTTGSSLIYPRKEAKTYGAGQRIEGIFAAGERAVIIEDLVTSGGSMLKTSAALAAAGLRVSDVIVLIDREQGGAEALAAAGCRLHAVFRLSEVMEVLRAAGRISPEQVTQVRNYLARP